MNLEQQIQGAKHYDEQHVVDKESMENRVFESLTRAKAPNKKHLLSQKKFIFILIPLLVIPLSGLAYAGVLNKWKLLFPEVHFVSVQTVNQFGPPLSTAAQPKYVNKILKLPLTTVMPLSQAIKLANFPIREPAATSGWTKIISVGYQFPSELYKNGKLVSVSKTPVTYLDIYTNARGQRIAVTQKRSQLPQTGTVGFPRYKNRTTLQGFPADDIATLISGNWADLPRHLPRGNFENVVVLHREKNNTITQITVDEYGNVKPSILETFARMYLQAPIQ